MRSLPLFLIISIFFLTPFYVSEAQEPPPKPEEPMPMLVNLQIDAIGPTIAEVEPTKEYKFQFKFYNGGTFQSRYYYFLAEFKVEVEGEGWSAYVSPSWTLFYPDEVRTGHIIVTASARPSNYAYIHLYGRIKDLPGRIFGYWHEANITFQVKLSQYHSFDISINKTFIKGRQEEMYSLPLKIKNYGNYEDRFLINIAYHPPRWKVGLSQTPIIIPPKGEATIYVYFAIPHEGIYIQEKTQFILIEVKSEMAATAKSVAVIVSLEGFHLTLGQLVALLSSMPSIILLAFVGGIVYKQNNPINYIPKPWKEEKEEIEKMDSSTKRRIKKAMKEEWKSAKYFMKYRIKEERKLQRLRRLKEIKQKKLEEKIKNAWNDAWLSLHNKWKEKCEEIKMEYEKMRKTLEKKMEDAKKLGIKIDITVPEPRYPPQPKKPPMPEIPEYRLDERRILLIEPDEIEIERILMPLKRNRMLIKRDIARIEEIGNEILESMKRNFSSIERRVEAEIQRKLRK